MVVSVKKPAPIIPNLGAKLMAKSEQGFHYYGSTAFEWIVSDSLDRVIKHLARSAGSATIKFNVKENGGLYAQVCRVELPQAAHYSIREYMPHTITTEGDPRKGERVPLTEVQGIRILTVSGKYKNAES